MSNIKPAKVLKLKTIKEKKVRVKKVRGKNFIKKLITVVICSVLILSVFGSVGYVLCLNDFAMTTIISKNEDKSIESLDDVLEKSFSSRYYNIKIKLQSYNISSDTVTEEQIMNIKAIKDNNNTYWATLNAEIGSMADYDFYYKNGKLYSYYQSFYSSSYTCATAQLFLQSLGYFYMFPSVLPSQTLISKPEAVESVTNSLHFNKNPFYFGQKYVITNDQTYCMVNMYPTTITYFVDYLGNLQNLKYEFNTSGVIYSLDLTYSAINQPFELEFPTDIDTH